MQMRLLENCYLHISLLSKNSNHAFSALIWSKKCKLLLCNEETTFMKTYEVRKLLELLQLLNGVYHSGIERYFYSQILYQVWERNFPREQNCKKEAIKGFVSLFQKGPFVELSHYYFWIQHTLGIVLVCSMSFGYFFGVDLSSSKVWCIMSIND